MMASCEAAGEDDHDHTYEGALDALLRSPLHQAKTKEELAKAAARRTITISDMKTYLKRLSSDHDNNNNDDIPLLNMLPSNIIHITGTKGKGSTCCLCESILRNRYGWKTGLFTSPHLVDIRERIRIDGKPISKEVFARVYWEVRTRLEKNAKADKAEEADNDDLLPVLPGYFRMLTLMALFAFARYQPKLDVIILEVGMGGRYDATNIIDMMIDSKEETTIIRRNVVCGVTLLDLDHTRVLGDTLEKIAWEKGGIFQSIKGQSSSPQQHAREPKQEQQQQSSSTDSDDDDGDDDSSFFAIDSNTPSVLRVLEKCAQEEGNGRKLNLVGDCTDAVPSDAVIGLPGKHQRINAELALALCQAIVKKSTTTATTTKTTKGSDTTQEDLLLRQALSCASWPGRCQTVILPTNAAKKSTTSINLRLDGSHTPISLRAGYEWFRSVSGSSSRNTTTTDDNDDDVQQQQPRRILIFNCSHERNPVELLQILLDDNLPSSSSNPDDHVTTDDDSDDRKSTTCSIFEKVFFCRSDFERPSAVTKKDAKALLSDANIEIRDELLPDATGTTTLVTWQMTLQSIWKNLESSCAKSDPSKEIHHNDSVAETMVNLTVGEALEQLSKPEEDEATAVGSGQRMEVFIVGSLYIVGSALNAIGWSEQEAAGDLRL